MKFSLATFSLLFACTDTGLQPSQKSAAAVLDDELQVQATVCTQPPADTAFPVKILFIVDMSDSMQITDPNNLRISGVTNLINRFQGDAAVSFGIITFGEHISISPGGFSNNPNAGNWFSSQSTDGTTDYQGALGAAYTLMAQDMLAAGPATCARTKYVIIFFTDGIPDPQCSAADALAGIPQPYGVCTIPREDWTQLSNAPSDVEQLFPALNAGEDYNQPYQIDDAVDNIMALEGFYHVGDIEMHTALLFDPSTLSNPKAIPFGITPDTETQAVALLTGMSQHGDGTFTEFNSATAISFLNFDYTSIQEPDALQLLFAVNTTTTFSGTDQVIDTDEDGLSDTTEFSINTCPGLSATCTQPTDSDGDGYSDWFENLERSAGFDPLDPKKPAAACTGAGRNDDDGDGLLNCEETFIGTDPRIFDSDADRIPDMIELMNGMNPLDPTDAQADDDYDGIRNVDEIKEHTNPQARDPANEDTSNYYSYDIESAPGTADGRTCYAVTVNNISLVTSGTGTKSPRGDNRVMIYFVEAPVDLPLDYGTLKVACINARYIDGEVKEPASGIMYLQDANFVDATTFNAGRDCVAAAGAGGTTGGGSR